MLKNFFKYQSLGNDFIIFDWYKKPKTYIDQTLSELVTPFTIQSLCDRHFGVGADGILVLKWNIELQLPEIVIFNSDGSKAEICLNGARCVALHLHTMQNFPDQFKIKFGTKIIECFILLPKNISEEKLIKTNIGKVNYLGEMAITITQHTFSGHIVDVGNPHFVVLDKISLDDLKIHGTEIEKHNAFPNKTNVEFVWQGEQGLYNSLVYERGCGITLACSSGAAAITKTLKAMGRISNEQEFNINMPGGTIICSINHSNEIILSAKASLVFSGIYTP